GLLVKEHVLPRQLRNLSLANAEREQRERAIAARRARAMQAQASISAEHGWPDGEDIPRARGAMGLLTQTGAVMRASAAVVLVGLFSHFVVPIESKLQDVVAKLAEVTPPGGGAATPPQGKFS